MVAGRKGGRAGVGLGEVVVGQRRKHGSADCADPWHPDVADVSLDDMGRCACDGEGVGGLCRMWGRLRRRGR